MKKRFYAFLKQERRSLIYLLIAAALIAASVALRSVLSTHPWLAEKTFVPIAKAVSNVLRRAVNLIPFSISEMLIVVLLLLLALVLLATVYFGIKQIVLVIRFKRFKAALLREASLSDNFLKSDAKIELKSEIIARENPEDAEPQEPVAAPRLSAFVETFTPAVFVFSVIFLYFNLAYGTVFYRPTIDVLMDLDKSEYSFDTLYSVAQTVADEARAAREELGDGIAASFEFDFNDLRNRTSEAYVDLQQENGLFSGIIAKPKPVKFSGVMSRLGIAGTYSPFFSESSISTDGIAASIPFTIAHEISHGVMFGREDEANFVAFLATTGSDDPLVRYSGYYRALCYLASAVYSVSGDKYQELWAYAGYDVASDRQVEIDHNRKNDGALGDAFSKFNDTVIKATGQQDGIKSYGNVVDLIVAYYR